MKPIQCKAEGCRKAVRLGHLMCPGHWALVPDELQERYRVAVGQPGWQAHAQVCTEIKTFVADALAVLAAAQETEAEKPSTESNPAPPGAGSVTASEPEAGAKPKRKKSASPI